MDISVYKTLTIISLVVLIVYYSSFIIYTPLRYDWPKDVKFREYGSTIRMYDGSCPRGFCYNIPFEIETSQKAEINLDRKAGNQFIINSKTKIITSENVEFKLKGFINKTELKNVPDIKLNDDAVSLKIHDNAYFIDTINIKKENNPNILEVSNLVISRKVYPIDEITIPILFYKDKYVESINIPQIFPYFIKGGKKSDEIRYDVEIPDYYKIDKTTSGFQKVSVPYSNYEPFNIGQIEPIRTGTINQEIDDISKKKYSYLYYLSFIRESILFF